MNERESYHEIHLKNSMTESESKMLRLERDKYNLEKQVKEDKRIIELHQDKIKNLYDEINGINENHHLQEQELANEFNKSKQQLNQQLQNEREKHLSEIK